MTSLFRDEAAHAAAFRQMMHDMTGDSEPAGMVIAHQIRHLAIAYDSDLNAHLSGDGLSGPRLALMLRLLAEESFGSGEAGVSPTHLSECQNVSKNTISSLLRGLEEQGLIERDLDPDDRRMFRIRLTGAGRRIVHETTAGHVAHLDHMVRDLDARERTQLITLLEKLAASIRRASTQSAASDDAEDPVVCAHERFDH